MPNKFFFHNIVRLMGIIFSVDFFEGKILGFNENLAVVL